MFKCLENPRCKCYIMFRMVLLNIQVHVQLYFFLLMSVSLNKPNHSEKDTL